MFLADRVEVLEDQKKDLDKKKLDVVNTETRISETELKLAEITSEIKPIEEKLQTIKSLETTLNTYDTKLEKLKVKYVIYLKLVNSPIKCVYPVAWSLVTTYMLILCVTMLFCLIIMYHNILDCYLKIIQKEI